MAQPAPWAGGVLTVHLPTSVCAPLGPQQLLVGVRRKLGPRGWGVHTPDMVQPQGQKEKEDVLGG